jgi:hypothetical protein
MKNAILFSFLFLGLTACGGGGSSSAGSGYGNGNGNGNGYGSNPEKAAQRNQNQVGFANDPNTPQISLDRAIVGKWSTDCQKVNSGNPLTPYLGVITDIRENGSMYTYRMLFSDKTCVNGITAQAIEQPKKFGDYELLDTADLQPTGEVHFTSVKKFENLNQGETRESMVHVAIKGRNAETLQLTTTDLMVKNGFQTVEDTKSRGKNKLAHRIQGI